jgi:hypothetical protein
VSSSARRAPSGWWWVLTTTRRAVVPLDPPPIAGRAVTAGTRRYARRAELCAAARSRSPIRAHESCRVTTPPVSVRSREPSAPVCDRINSTSVDMTQRAASARRGATVGSRCATVRASGLVETERLESAGLPSVGSVLWTRRGERASATEQLAELVHDRIDVVRERTDDERGVAALVEVAHEARRGRGPALRPTPVFRSPT